MAEQIKERIGTGDTPTLLGGDFNARTDSNVICEVMKNWQEMELSSPVRSTISPFLEMVNSAERVPSPK